MSEAAERSDDPNLHPGPRDEGGQGGMATREQATREQATREQADREQAAREKHDDEG